MFRRFITFLKSYVSGEEIIIEGEITVSWWEFGAILIIIGLIVRWIWWL
jgi:hypothetical protein